MYHLIDYCLGFVMKNTDDSPQLYTSNTNKEIFIDPEDYKAVSSFKWFETDAG